MCGITGWVAYERNLAAERATAEAMTETMACRGPDEAGTWIAGPVALGHRRLAIIDLPGGSQPMAVETPEGPVVLVYSGETYNHGELRRELSDRGHRFRTRSDTEVVLRAYLEWGADLAERLNGMYAFAVWDGRSGRLTLVRDRMGVKPLYYAETADGVLFGSEPKALLANPLARRAVGADGLRELFTLVRTPGQAIWEGMREVEPGTVVTVGRDGLRTRVYWRLETRPHTDGRRETVERVRELLDDIVSRQLVSDVPRCTLLSGGLDSSAMTALAARQLRASGGTVRSFAVDFVGRTENFVADELRATPDTPFVHDVARESATEHQDIVLGSEELADPELRARVVRARDIPAGFGDMDASLHLLFEAVRRRSTVALSGESADEVFGGYKQFFDEDARRGGTFPWLARGAHSPGVAGGLLDDSVARALDLPGYERDSYADAVSGIRRAEGESDFEYRMRVLCHLHLTRFVRVLLDRKDRASMAVGLEVRVPFCDHRLVEYVYNTPWALKSFDGREKSLLREATADVLPRSVYDRAKSPYPATQDPKYHRALQRNVEELLAAPSHPVFDLVSRERLERMARTPAAGSTRNARYGMERALDLALWIDMYAPTLTLS
ncbi:asparagine synthase [Streptomyces qinglanensis]|uniref:asparagine synthase (glutamine-hydrolyzing) n=1 Tax=Streptomyces qinglanensis TaxID=943816 RepID=A0A1E7K4S9_9ACTN|nr:asparagine synthase (glutamine-hydrolyzing) [Streptomyces qinglanensis]OEU98937.1 asparagine synthase [Streptomyces qinglanensis]OEV23114.1 asparagine synthase [Streptomyces nanshensis]